MYEIQAWRGTGFRRGLLHRDGDVAMPRNLDPRVVEVYRGVGQLLRRYTVGRLPKAFKIIPNLRNWEEVCLTPG